MASGPWTLAAVQWTAGIPSQESWCLLQKNTKWDDVTFSQYNGTNYLALEGWNNDLLIHSIKDIPLYNYSVYVFSLQWCLPRDMLVYVTFRK